MVENAVKSLDIPQIDIYVHREGELCKEGGSLPQVRLYSAILDFPRFGLVQDAEDRRLEIPVQFALGLPFHQGFSPMFCSDGDRRHYLE